MFEVLTKRAICAAVVAGGAMTMLGSMAVAEDIFPPPWERFRQYTTFQEWDFLTPSGGPPDGGAPGNWYNEDKANDLPFLTPGPAVSWDNEGWYGQGGDDSYLEFFCPNWIDQEPYKWLWIQINGVWPTAGAPGPSVLGVVGVKGTEPPYFGSPLGGGDAIPGFHRVEKWELKPNPDLEYIRIFVPQGVFVNQVVIDTISFPAPGAIAAFGIFGLATSRRRR